jgi:hypothetical protein
MAYVRAARALVIDSSNRVWRRVLGLAVCYAVALQAFLAAFGAALAVSHRSGAADGLTIICHGANGTTQPSGDGAGKLPCALCAVATAGGGLLPDLVAAAVAPLTGSSIVRRADAVLMLTVAQSRAGLARAPPNFA